MPETMNFHLGSAVQDLEALLNNLQGGDRNFSESLIKSYKRYGTLTPKQAPYIHKMLEKAMGTNPEPQIKVVDDLTGLKNLFAKAKEKIKYPSIVINFEAGGHLRELKIWIQGERSKFPGSVAVLLDKHWVGRILENGNFQWATAYQTSGIKDELLDILTQLSSNPAATAAKYGKLYGSCVFCHKKLNDPKSLAVGYGATCASHFGLEWGTEKFNPLKE